MPLEVKWKVIIVPQGPWVHYLPGNISGEEAIRRAAADTKLQVIDSRRITIHTVEKDVVEDPNTIEGDVVKEGPDGYSGT
jgi:hypothetical protein